MKMAKLTFVALLLIASVPLTLGQGTYTQIDYPGAIETQALGIDTAGDIVGGYIDSSLNYHGFLLSGGVYTTIDDPDVPGAFAYGINDVGQIVGNNGELNSGSGGYLYDLGTQTFTPVSFPNSNALTFPYGINNAGVIVGAVAVPHRGGDDVFGFELRNGSYQLVIHPLGSTDTQLRGINNLGQAVGFQFTGSISNNFLYVGGEFQPVRIFAKDATIIRANDDGAIVGLYFPSTGNEQGFLYQTGSFQEISFAGSLQTIASGINDSGVVVGYFSPGGNDHGFIWTPPADAGKK